ncbi:hypothetical protein [Kitasatospora sp. NPDC056181]|uniref:hypothetical protein n=1 Tax=Kitasatospora sp. NPDC056181 TaxID=3345737 RepID=UPI0035DE1B46
MGILIAIIRCDRATELATSAATIRRERQRRDTQPYAQRIAEAAARRIQAAQLAAEQQRTISSRAPTRTAAAAAATFPTVSCRQSPTLQQ